MANQLTLEQVNEFLASMGIQPLASFRSGSLPVESQNTASLASDYNIDGTALTKMDAELTGLDGSSEILSANDDFVVEGVASPGGVGISPADSADNNRALSIPGENRTNWMKPREKSFSEKRREQFLNLGNSDTGPIGSMQALRAADAATGRFSQGGKYFYNDDGNLAEVNKEAYRKGQHVQLSPEELKAAYVKPIEATMVPVEPIFDDTKGTRAEQVTSDLISTSNSVLDDLDTEYTQR